MLVSVSSDFQNEPLSTHKRDGCVSCEAFDCRLVVRLSVRRLCMRTEMSCCAAVVVGVS